MRPGMQGMMREIQKVQKKINDFQEELKKREFVASVGGGVVEVKALGTQEIVSVKIQKEALNPDDVEMLEEMVKTAVNDVLGQIQDEMSKGMSRITGGLSIPGLF